MKTKLYLTSSIRPGILTRSLRQSGDTIVEVLISIAVISLVLGGAFITTRNSQQGVRNSQEHAEALKLLESQIEQLRTAAETPSSTLFSITQPFCMYQGSPQSTTAIDISTGTPYCTQDSTGAPTNTQPIYSLSIQCQVSVICPDANNGWLFSAQVSWPEVTGGQGTETMLYRVYQ